VSQLSSDLASLKIDREPKAPGRRGFPSWLLWVLVAAVIAGVGYFFAYPRLQAVLNTAEVRTGEVQIISPAQGQVTITSTGYVVALVNAKVAAKVSGRIAEIYVEEGQKIEKGQRVARLEDIDQKSALAAARARAAASRSDIATARAQLAEVKAQLTRERQMVASGVSAKAVADDLQAKADSLSAAVSAASAQAAATAAEAKSLEVQLESVDVVSPIAGTVVDKLVEVGEGVSPGFGTPGVIEVVDMDSLVVEIDVPEGKISALVLGGPCEIVLDAYPETRMRGSVKEIGRRINRAKATVPVKVSFIDKPKEVLPDMAARVSFLSAALDEKTLALPPRLVVPASAVVSRGGADVVFTLEDGEVRMTTVQADPPRDDLRDLKTQIPVGTKVVLNPPASLKDGEKVKEKN
jgi:RND family efflux transporter MFP subunit